MAESDWAFASFGPEDSTFDAFSQQTKNDWPQYYAFGRDLADPSTSVLVPPTDNTNNFMEMIDHPETDDDEEDEDDGMDFDLPAVSPYDLELTPANMISTGPSMPSSSFQFTNFASRLPSAQYSFSQEWQPQQQYYDSYDAFPKSQYSRDPYQQDFAFAPTQSVNPANLQLRSDSVNMAEESHPHFSLPSPVIVADELSPMSSFEDSMRSDFTDEDTYNVINHETSDSHYSEGSDFSSQDPDYNEQPKVHSVTPTTKPATSGGNKSKRNLQKTHFCELTLGNGEQCSKAFTRPYDLARHQETIHASVRKIYTCEACGENSKTFSRLDALSRHIRIKHSGSGHV